MDDDAMMRVLREPMTIVQLKRHMDRRFDRLDRVKANKSDLQRFATKSELRRELRKYATKADLRRMAARAEVLAVDTRRYFQIVAEDLRDEVKKIGELADLKSIVALHSAVLHEHESRITDLEHPHHPLT